jgi:threonine dehydrogenase-like Zn-dependent dehydrogenase
MPTPAIQLLIQGPREVRAMPQERPTVPPGQVLVRAIRSLISPGTELSFFEGTHIALPDPNNGWAKYPFRAGYAMIGEVVELGAGVSEPALGARVFFFGYHAHWNLLPVGAVWVETPSDLSDDEVLLCRMVQIAATGVEVLRRPPASALVIGAGLIGLFAAETLRARGCPLVVVQDVLPSRLEFVRRAGLIPVLADSPLAEPVRAAFGGKHPACVVEATGLASMIPLALEAVADLGDVSLLGIPRGETTLNLYRLLVRKNVALLGAHEGLIPDRAPPGASSRQALVEEAIAHRRAGLLHFENLVTAHVKPVDCQDVYSAISRNKGAWITAVYDWAS